MALVFHIRSLKRGATTGEKKANQKRSQESSLNKRKCPELAQLLYAWLIDGPQTYRAGFDRFFLRRQRRCLAQHLPDIGYSPQDMPKWPGTDWYQWFRKWRQRFGVSIRTPLSPAKCKLQHRKVSLDELKERTRVYLNNMFALRYYYRRAYFPEVPPMRGISWDQKTAWFNNTCGDRAYAPIGYTPQMRELGAHGKQRFTMCTCVDSAASNKGAVWRELTALPDIPAWMHLQTQEKGSYRAEDMLELVEKFLPDVSGTDGSESQIIQLDWYAAHRDQRIAKFIRSRGHLLLLHGGGNTDY